MVTTLQVVSVPAPSDNNRRKSNHRKLNKPPRSPEERNKLKGMNKRVVISTSPESVTRARPSTISISGSGSGSGSGDSSTISSSVAVSSKSSKISANSAFFPPSPRTPFDDKSHSSQLSSHTTKTAASFQRKARLPKFLKFTINKNTKKKKKKKPIGDDDDSHGSSISRRTKSQLLTEFSTLMNEFPTEDTLNTTLHVACSKHYSAELIVDQLIAKGPSAVTMRNQQRDLPLHCAMRCNIDTGVEDRVFDELLRKYPSGVEATNNDNCLPIHLACQSGGRNVNAVKKLLAAYPLSAIMKCDLKLPFDDRAFDFVDKSSRKGTSRYANDDRIKDTISEDESQDLDSCSTMFWSTFLMLSPKNSFEPEINAGTANPGLESDFSPLHLAVLFGAPPDVIEAIITTNPACLGLRTDQGRSAMDCALYAVAGKKNQRPEGLSILRVPTDDDEEDEIRINKYINYIDEDPVQNIFAAIEIIKTFESNRRKSMRLANATTMTAKSMRELGTIEEFDPQDEWRKLGNLIRIAGAFKRPQNALGAAHPFDANKAVQPPDYNPPDHLNHICVDIKIPVGFRRLRWAMLSSSSNFLGVEVLQNKLKYSNVEVGAWEMHNDNVGKPNLPETVSKDDFIGNQRKCQYLMPKSGMVSANMAYETHTIVDYNDFAFVTRKVVTNPDVPFGTSFKCIVQTIFTNLGYNNCRMIASVEAEFVGRPPMVAWKIKNAMYNGVTDFFVATGETICEHAFREAPNAKDA